MKGKLSSDDKILNIATKTGEYLQQDRSFKLLGLILDEELNFNDHIDMLCNKLAKRIVNGLAPDYLVNKFPKVSDISKRRSSRFSNVTFVTPKYNRETEGGKSFIVSAIKLWNSIPAIIRLSSNIRTFKKNYRIFLMQQHVDLDHFNRS